MHTQGVANRRHLFEKIPSVYRGMRELNEINVSEVDEELGFQSEIMSSSPPQERLACDGDESSMKAFSIRSPTPLLNSNRFIRTENSSAILA